MEDRFKFRAYDLLGKKWIDLKWLVIDPEEGRLLEPADGDCVIFDNTDYILMQCTGLKDKNGKLIYEGDIVNGIDGWKESKTLIEYGFHCDHSSYKSQLGFNIWEDDEEDLEVIGNIYENPELLNNASK